MKQAKEADHAADAPAAVFSDDRRPSGQSPGRGSAERRSVECHGLMMVEVLDHPQQCGVDRVSINFAMFRSSLARPRLPAGVEIGVGAVKRGNLALIAYAALGAEGFLTLANRNPL